MNILQKAINLMEDVGESDSKEVSWSSRKTDIKITSDYDTIKSIFDGKSDPTNRINSAIKSGAITFANYNTDDARKDLDELGDYYHIETMNDAELKELFVRTHATKLLGTW